MKWFIKNLGIPNDGKDLLKLSDKIELERKITDEQLLIVFNKIELLKKILRYKMNALVQNKRT